MESTVLQRVKLFRDSQKLSTNRLASILGMSQTTLNDYFIGRSTKVPMSLAEILLNEFPLLSAEWLFRGEGSMLRDVEAQNTSAKLDEALRENDMTSKILEKMNIEELVREEIKKQLSKKA